MTALAGVVSRGQYPLSTACRAILDAQRIYGAQSAVEEVAGAAFGVRLLPVVPEDEFDQQPLRNERLLFVADARIDNRAEIAGALNVAPTSAAFLSDSELFFRAWTRWEERCLDQIVGDFALAIFDIASETLTLARDVTGQRPLFYKRSAGLVRFASMPSGLLGDGPVEHDLQFLARFMASRSLPQDSSWFAGVQAVPPGCLVSIDRNTAVTRSYWMPSCEARSDAGTEELTEEYRSGLDSAVKSRMRRIAGPVATHLSSGFDSNAVTATAARISQPDNDIIAFTAAPGLDQHVPLARSRFADETKLAADAARFYEIQHLVVRTRESLFATIGDYCRFHQEPVGNLFNLEWWDGIEREAHQLGANVLLVGQMGNWTLSAGGASALSEWIRRGDIGQWWRQARAVALHNQMGWRGIAMASLEAFMPPRISQLIRRWNAGGLPATSPFLSQEWRQRVERVDDSRPGSLAAQRLWLIQRQNPAQLRKGSLAKNGIDERDPTADRRLIELSLALPPNQLLDRGKYRPLARLALSDRVPDFILSSKLRGYQGADWFQRLHRAEAEAAVEEIASHAQVQQLMDLDAIRRAVADWPDLANTSPGSLETFGRNLTRAISAGLFMVESSRYTERLGR